MAFSRKPLKTIFTVQNNSEVRMRLENLVNQYGLHDYIVCMEKSDEGYIYYLEKYLSLTNDNFSIVIKS